MKKYLLKNFLSFLLYFSLSKVFRRKYNSTKILFTNLGLLGDTVISTIILANENNFSCARNVFFVVREEYKSLFADYKGEFNVVFINVEKYKLNIFYRISVLRNIRKNKIGISYNLSFVRHSMEDEIALLSGANEVFAYKSKEVERYFEIFFNKSFSKLLERKSKNDFLEYAFLIESITKNNSTKSLKIFPILKNQPKSDQIEITINVDSSAEIKNWGMEKFQNLIIKLSFHEKIHISIVGKKRYLFSENLVVENLTGKTSLTEIIQIIYNSHLFIGNDSGLLHISKYFQVPIIGIIGGGAIGRIYPYLENQFETLIFEEMDCFGCQWNCIKEEPFCHTKISDKIVYLKTLEMLEKIRGN